ncbi:hypothetical protein PAN31117_04463 [Pandoraea anapnoica]|uniref:Uncharacterized protein n=1 Tax=Pandoraea anapnoica TaxID=2508301 RepID=A0A5E5AJC8_9BURK|nr:hypothetical protein [Pandoraea anapnoica]VVE72633.1 hypothetical protein PAN31117_04463 [Pandoraea anapnoica]
MAFNNIGPLTFLNPNQAAYWWYVRNGGEDLGTQFASADVKTPNSGGIHRADNQRKEKDNNGHTTYYVTITNLGPGGAWHNLQGGGMV